MATKNPTRRWEPEQRGGFKKVGGVGRPSTLGYRIYTEAYRHASISSQLAL